MTSLPQAPTPRGGPFGPLRAAVLALEEASIKHGKVAIDREAAIIIVGHVIEAYIAALDQFDQELKRRMS